MKYKSIDKTLFENNRKNLVKRLKSNSLAVFNSNDILPTSADGTLPFRQASDIFYMSGIDQEESILVVFPDAAEDQHREILFLRETNEEIAIWEGHKYTMEEARAVSGVKTVYWMSRFESVFNSLMVQAEYVYLNTNEHTRAANVVQTRDGRFIQWCRERYPLHKYERLQPILHELRAIKSDIEIELIQQAVDITAKGFDRVLRFVRPDVMEYEIEAEIIHEFIANRASGFAFEPIIASGFNACVLHYVDNNDVCSDGELVLMDFGANYANYNGDLTRTIPVNGRFTKRQRDVYDAVLRVQREAMKLLVPGNTILQYHKEVGAIMEKELVQLGLLDATDIKNQNPDQPAYKKYFMHGTSHHLGVDVHDYGNMYREFAPGMVFTVEPGIYIREESLGIRLENNVVVAQDSVRDLTAHIPIEPDEIEEIMNS
jgi:Xaa-Pro aminopeptidase